MNRQGIASVTGEILLVVFVLAVVAVFATFVFGFPHLLPDTGMIPAFTISRKNESTIQVCFHQSRDVVAVERLLVRQPVKVKGSLNSSVPTGKLEFGTTLTSIGVKPGDHFVVSGTISGKEMVVIDLVI